MRAAYSFLVLLMLSITVVGQPASTNDLDQLLAKLERSLEEGNKRALRDLGSLATHPEFKNKVRRILKNYLILTEEEFEITNPLDKVGFMRFFYDHEEQLQYSDLYNSYYLTDLDKRKVSYKIQMVKKGEEADASVNLKNYIQAIDEAIKESDAKTLIKTIQKVADLNIPEAYQYLIELAESQPLDPKTDPTAQRVYEEIGMALESHQTLDALYSIMTLLDKSLIPTASATSILANLTNVRIESNDPQSILQSYAHYIDSLSTLEEIRAFGYNRIFGFRPTFFVESVDYYGRLLSRAKDMPWIEHNALIDLSYSQHPRALFYMAGLLYKYRKASGKQGRQKSKALVQLMQQLTQIEIGVPDKSEEIDFKAYSRKDRKARLNFLIYWASHYHDYEWDDNRSLFVNKFEAIEKTQNYERLFRRLNSRNDSVAVESFIQLTEGTPSEVVALAEKYRQMFRTYNHVLPSFQFKYLEQLALLTHYCRKNNVPYKANRKLKQKLDQLLAAQGQTERYIIENKIIQSLQLKETTALEYWACLNEGNTEVNFSISRILDWFYSRKWQEIVHDERELRLYLKKAQLFGYIGAIGSCNSYLNKLNVKSPDLQNALHIMAKTETDQGITYQLNTLLDHSEMDEDEGFSLTDFLEDPASFHKRDIKILATPKASEYPLLIEAIKSTEDLAAIKRIFFYIRLHPVIEMVPHLFELIDDDRILIKKRKLELTVADNLAPVLEGIYNYSFPETETSKKFDVEPWRDMWTQQQSSYREWIDIFFANKLEALKTSPTLDIEDINQITSSVHYNESYKAICLEALKKVEPKKDIRQLHMEPKLSVLHDLKYLEPFDFSYKVLDDIPKLFNVDDPEKMMNFLRKKAASFDLADRGSLYNNFFRTSWFSLYVGNGVISEEMANHIKNTLLEYFNESEYLSEFEEQATQLHIAQLIMSGKDLGQQLLSSIEMETDEASKTKIQQSIIARVNYAQIPQVVRLLDQLSPELGETNNIFLSKDFGLPIFDLGSKKVRDELISKHAEWSEYDFYLHYLKAFHLDFLKNETELDYQKIYNILQYDIVSPFVSSSGGKRDYYVYGIIKLLELTFNDRLSFHEKLNESQTFYSFSSTKRANAWCKYLLDKQLVKVQMGVPPSFNPLKAEN